MGSIWAAEHILLKAPVAVKVIVDSMRTQPALRTRFEREALAAAQLKSPHIVAVSDFGFDGDVPYMVMELLEGEDLAQRLQRGGAMMPRDVLAIAIPIAKALSKAHAAKVVHRDLKPANIFLARTDDGEVVKVVDFGIAKVEGATKERPDDPTSTDSLLGSPTYMSPEQVRTAREVDGRADLWALAVIVFRMLTNAVPFDGATPGDLLVKICTEPPKRLSAIAPHLPPSLDAFFTRALQKDPNHRFQTAQELANALAGALGASMPFDATGRHSLPSFDPTSSQTGSKVIPPIALPVEQAQTLATNHSGPRKPVKLSPSTLALAAAPVAALVGIGLLALWRSSPSSTEPPNEMRTPAIRVDVPSGGELPATPVPVVSAVDPAPAAQPTSEPSAEPAASAGIAPSASASASAAPQAPTAPKPKERIRFGL